MPAPVWYAASLLVITAVVFYKLGRVAGHLDGYDQGWDAGRAARVEQLLDAADSVRALTLVPAPPYDPGRRAMTGRDSRAGWRSF